MMISFPSQTLLGWSALVNAAAGVAGFTALILFFTVGGLWGPVNDVLSVIWAVSLIPLAVWLFQLNQPVQPAVSGAAAVLGVGAMLVFATLQGLLVVKVVRYEQTVRIIMALTGLIGVWLTANAVMLRGSQALPGGLGWAMLVFGLGLICAAIGYWLGGEQSTLAAVGYFGGFIAGAVWAFWLARLLLASGAAVKV